MRNYNTRLSAAIMMCLAAVLTAATAFAITVPLPGMKQRVASLNDPFPTLKMAPMPAATAKAKPLVSPSGATIVGWHAYPQPIYFGELVTSGDQVYYWENSQLSPSAGFVKDGKFYAYLAQNASGYLTMGYYICNISTGEIIESGDLNMTDASQYVFMCAYDEFDNIAYAYTYNADGSGKLLQMIDPDTRSFSNICEVTQATTPQVMGFNIDDRNLYGVSRSGDFVRISKIDGTFEVVCNTGIVPSNYKQAMTYSPVDRCFYWAALCEDLSSCIVRLDPAAGTSEVTGELPQFTEWTILATTDLTPAGTLPMRPTVKSVNFAGASLSGTVTVTAPSTCYDGSSIRSNITIASTIDGADNGTITVAAGADGDVEFNCPAKGLHTFAFTAIDAAGNHSPTVSCTRYIGSDRPTAPTGVTIDENGVKWDAVTTGVNGGWVDADAMRYNVYVNGTLINSQPVAGTELANSLPNGNLKAFVASVEATYDGLTSDRGYSPTFMWGSPYTVPVEFTFTDDEVALCSIVNSNGDNFMWCFDTANRYFYYSYGANNADDWVFLPVTEFADADALYVVNVDAWVRSQYYPESFEIAYGAEPKPGAMTVVGTYDEVKNQNTETYSAYFNVPAAGSYYVGIHCISPSYKDRLYFNRVSIAVSSRSAACPAPATGVTAKAADRGELKALVSFTMPTKTISGADLPADAVLTATVSRGDVSTTVSGAPGEAFSGIEIATEQGSNEISVAVGLGEDTSEAVVVSVYTGLAIPGSVSSLKAVVADDNMSAHFTWNAPTWAATDGFYDTESLRYYYCDYDWTLGKWVEKQELGAVNEFDFTVPASSPMDVQYVGILAENDGGKSSYVSYKTVTLGTPYELPMAENYTNGKFTYKPVITVAPNTYYSGKCSLAKPENYGATNDSENNYAMVSAPSNSYGESYCLVALPKFSTEDVTGVKLNFRVWGGASLATSEIRLISADVAETMVASFWNDLPEQWNDIEIDLPAEFYGKKWVEARVFSHFYPGDPKYTIVDRYTIEAETSGVSSIAQGNGGITVTGGEGCISVSSKEPADVAIYITCGTLVARERVAAGSTRLSMAQGIYVVRTAGNATKVAVR